MGCRCKLPWKVTPNVSLDKSLAHGDQRLYRARPKLQILREQDEMRWNKVGTLLLFKGQGGPDVAGGFLKSDVATAPAIAQFDTGHLDTFS